MIVKHLYQRTITKNGKKIKCWYFWYWHNGKQVRKTCGINGQPCLLKRDAEKFISELKDDELIPQIKACSVTLNDFASGMYDKDSAYLTKLHNKGIDITELTRKQKKNYLDLILNRFGEFPADSLDMGIIDNWLLEQKRSNSWRNNCLAIFNAIFKELYIYKIIPAIPLIEYYKRVDQEEKGILTTEEIEMLFPKDFDKLMSIWHLNNRNRHFETLIFATMTYTALTTGMRNGEIRAVLNNQLIREDAILINGRLDTTGKRQDVLKSGCKSNKRWRITILPERTVEMIKLMKSYEPNHLSDYLFEYHGKPFSPEYVTNHFVEVLMHNGIDCKKRNITFHSLRFTYDTMLHHEISPESLIMMMGHTNPKMSDYYDKSSVTDHLPNLLENKAVINSIFQ